ncbi:MAG: VOC family protein [Longimicrobiales bacterium]|nr:VOC family protein [Longimicrobiales bacterium]
MHRTQDREYPYGVEPPGFRLPDATRLGPVRLQVADLERSLSYYAQVVGLVPVRDGGSSLALGAIDGGEPLIELVEHPGARPVPRRGRLGLFHFAILLPDRASLGSFVRQLKSEDIGFGASDHLVSEAVYLYDPDGLGIEVYADRPRASWRHQGRQLLMATDPMDVEDVMRSSDGSEWKGLPRGTRMGHVHLHVGELDAARRFYHDGLGMDLMVWSYPGALFLSAGGYHHHLGLNSWAAGAPPAAEDEARLLDWQLVLPSSDDVDRALRSLQGLPDELASGREDGVVTDPWGTRLRLRPES